VQLKPTFRLSSVAMSFLNEASSFSTVSSDLFLDAALYRADEYLPFRPTHQPVVSTDAGAFEATRNPRFPNWLRRAPVAGVASPWGTASQRGIKKALGRERPQPRSSRRLPSTAPDHAVRSVQVYAALRSRRACSPRHCGQNPIHGADQRGSAIQSIALGGNRVRSSRSVNTRGVG
jgi:hypothetical protein